MKKLLGIIVLGIILSSCSTEKNQIENCADYKWGKSLTIPGYAKGFSLKQKFKRDSYKKFFRQCEIAQRMLPESFKETWK